MGQNPTSGLLSVKRRKEIYALVQKFDIIIIEDDPYWYLQYPSANALSVKARGKPVSTNFPTDIEHNYNTTSGGRSSGFPFLDSLVPSYLSIDVDGRVLRLDTFSKTVAPGCRLGWITAQPAVVEKVQLITETGTQQPSGFVQSLIAELLLGPSAHGDPGKGGSKDGSGWGIDGWVRWLEGLRGNYERRMQIMANILDEGQFLIQDSLRRPSISQSDADEYQVLHKTQLYDFAYPMAGMFLWLRAHFETHPLIDKVSGQRLSQALWIFMTKKPYLVLLAPGAMFSPTQEIMEEKGWQYYRLCFAAVDDELVEKHSRGTVNAFVDFWAIDDVKKIDELLEDTDADARLTAIEAENQVSLSNRPIDF
jgi:DNA-binding transcriptional MocR family regulator